MTINVGELLVQGHYGVAIGRFEPANLWLQGTEHASTPCTPTPCLVYHKISTYRIRRYTHLRTY